MKELIEKLDDLLGEIIEDYGDSEIADGCGQAITLVREAFDGKTLVPDEPTEASEYSGRGT